MGHDGLRVYLRLATDRVALDSPVMRLGALAHAALELAGARVLESDEAGVPGKARDDAISWLLQHDRLLHDLVAAGPGAPTARGPGIVLSNDVGTVARDLPDGRPGSTPVLWASPASCLLDPPDAPTAALTLTTADAQLLADRGIRAVSLLTWPTPPPVGDAPQHVVIAVAADADPEHLRAAVHALATVLPGRPVIDVVPDAPLVLDGVRHAPRHPWTRSRLVRSCDLVVVIGRSAGTDLLAAEAALSGTVARRLVTVGTVVPHEPALSAAVAALPEGLGLAPAEPGGDGKGPLLAVDALAGWLIDVTSPTTASGEKES